MPGDRLAGVYLLVAAGGREALVPGAQLVEVADDVQVEALPVLPAHVAGSFRRRGRRLLALDLASLLGAEAEPAGGAPVLIFTGGFALRVERVELARGPLKAASAPQPTGAGWSPRLAGSLRDRVLPLLDAEGLASLAGIREAGEVQRGSPAGAEGDVELVSLESSLVARGMSLCPRLRKKLRAYFSARAVEPGASAPGELPLLPTILAGEHLAVCALIDSAVDGDTWFFRDATQLAALRKFLFEAEPGRDLRIWSAGCGSGEEAYSLAMSLAAARCGGTVLGTDVDERALAHARTATYGRRSFRQPEPELERYLFPGPPPAMVVPEIRQRVEFRRHDVLDDPPESGFDAVLCRNVLGLLSSGQGYRALLNVVSAVRPGGYLLLGASETSLADALPLERVSAGGAVLLRRPWSPRRLRPEDAGAVQKG
ncbi:MAG TPA: CheR family methyltransferase [Anaeromyxobacteraceae bacterium]|nr:CheR family methyltransferase [Anaeromyxobacteraceae bacterium]